MLSQVYTSNKSLKDLQSTYEWYGAELCIVKSSIDLVFCRENSNAEKMQINLISN